jgi:hypothetical protein
MPILRILYTASVERRQYVWRVNVLRFAAIQGIAQHAKAASVASAPLCLFSSRDFEVIKPI